MNEVDESPKPEGPAGQCCGNCRFRIDDECRADCPQIVVTYLTADNHEATNTDGSHDLAGLFVDDSYVEPRWPKVAAHKWCGRHQQSLGAMPE